MIIKDVRGLMAQSTGPVVKLLRQSEHYKVLVIGLKRGEILKEHKTTVPARLIVTEGNVTYHEGERDIDLAGDQDLEIPVNVPHSLLALEDSICLLIQG